MPDSKLSIMVVDDARFSSTLIGRALQQAGYHDLRYADSASEALEELRQRPADVLLADWLMPEMDGLELTDRLRQFDELSDHYTYIILLTGSDGDSLLATAFDRGVDDFVNKAAVNEQLVPRVLAAERLCATLQRLQQEKRQLTHSIACLEQLNVVDPLTGLGNLRYLRQHLGNALRQLESRGGALCYLLIELEEPSASKQHNDEAERELLYGVARRLQRLMRPLDTLAYLDQRRFASVIMVEDLRECGPGSFRRLHEGLNLKALKTSNGFVPLQAAIAMVGVEARDCPIDIEHLMRQAVAQLADARGSGRIACQPLQPVALSTP